jgi:hypothetical protein
MAKKPKNESIQDIIDRIEEDLIELRDKVSDLEDQVSDSDSDEDEDDDDSDDDSDKE